VSLYALDAVDDAVGPTRALVARLSLAGWLKLGAVTLFVGGVGSASFSANLPLTAVRSVPTGPVFPGGLAEVSLTVGVAVALVVAAVAALLVRSGLEFVLYEALRGDAVRVREPLRRWWRHALGLWAFRLAVAAAALAGSAAVLAAADVGPGVESPGDSPLVLVGLAVVLGSYALVAGLTTRFVVPAMVATGAGVVGAWRRLVGAVAASPGQYLAYLLAGPVVRFVADVVALSAVVLLAALLAVPVAAVVVPALLVVGRAPRLALSPPLILLSGGLPAGYLLAVLVGAVLLRLPLVVYVRLYALAVLRGTAPSLDPTA